MRVFCRGFGGGMPQVFLNQSQMDSGFQQMSGVGMPQRLGMDPFLNPRFPDDQPQDILHRLKWHWPEGKRRAVFSPSRRGKEKMGMPVRKPMLPQHIQCGLWQGDIAVFLPLARPDMDHHPG